MSGGSADTEHDWHARNWRNQQRQRVRAASRHRRARVQSVAGCGVKRSPDNRRRPGEGNFSQREKMQEVRQHDWRSSRDLRVSVRNLTSLRQGAPVDIDFVIDGPEMDALAEYSERLAAKANGDSGDRRCRHDAAAGQARAAGGDRPRAGGGVGGRGARDRRDAADRRWRRRSRLALSRRDAWMMRMTWSCGWWASTVQSGCHRPALRAHERTVGRGIACCAAKWPRPHRRRRRPV